MTTLTHSELPSQVCFADNPLSGLLILVGLFVGDVMAGLGAVVCSLAAVIVALVIHASGTVILITVVNFTD